jgi:hypothetical protein
VLTASDDALARTDGYGLEQFLRAIGQSFADHARYADLFLARSTDERAARSIRSAINELAARAVAAGTVNPAVTPGDVMVLIWAMRGLVRSSGQVAPGAWQRFLDIHLTGIRSVEPVSDVPPLTARQLARL